ncbi:MAG: SLC13 family permease [Acidiferrobacterales bacterium]
MNIPLVILIVVFMLIAVRRLGRLHIAIWQAMVGGAVAVLLTGQIGIEAAWRAIDSDVMLFLLGMFVIGEAVAASGYLHVLAYRLFSRAASADVLVLMILFGAGFASMMLMNDTVAIIGTPLMLRLAREHRLDSRLMLLALAFSVTIGSVASPIGNPQNLLIAVRTGMHAPFGTFFRALAVPTMLNLMLAYGTLRLFFWRVFHSRVLTHAPVTVSDPALARLARISLLLVIGLVVISAAIAEFGGGERFRISWIAVASALPLLVFSPRRGQLLRNIDWGTLAFFAGMFVLTDSVWQTGYFQSLLARSQIDLVAVHSVMGLSVVLSQLISNVPLVALYLPLLSHAGGSVQSFLALAAGSTIAGNLLILGAASNVIIVHNAERRGASLTFLEFARVGIPLTAFNLAIYWLFLSR